MTRPTRFVAVRPVGDDTYPYWMASSRDGREVDLEDGETVLWSGRLLCPPSLKATNGRWNPSDFTGWVTDRRVAFLSSKLPKGGGAIGFGAVGLTAATVLNHYDKKAQEARNSGRVAVGHVRHEWVFRLDLRQPKALTGKVMPRLELAVPTEGAEAVLGWTGGHGELDEAWISWLAKVITHHRQGMACAHPEEMVQRFDFYLAGGRDLAAGKAGPLDATWYFPGNPDVLAETAYRFYMPPQL